MTAYSLLRSDLYSFEAVIIIVKFNWIEITIFPLDIKL